MPARLTAETASQAVRASALSAVAFAAEHPSAGQAVPERTAPRAVVQADGSDVPATQFHRQISPKESFTSSVGSGSESREDVDSAGIGRQRSASGLVPITAQGHKRFGDSTVSYEMEEVLGEGSYGSVYRCRRSSDGVEFAAKVIDTMRIGFVGGEVGMKAAETMAVREIDALRQLSSHPNVISLEEGFINKSTRQIFIVMELVPGGHLFSHITQCTMPLQEVEASHIVAQVSDALSFCHALGVIHRDIKLENILVDTIDMQLLERKDPVSGAVEWQTVRVLSVKMCDFGFAKSLQAYDTRTRVGTGCYAAPEINIDGSPQDKQDERLNYDGFKADSFSLGVMIFVMLCHAFPPKDESKFSHKKHKQWSKLSPDAQSLIDGLLEVEPVKRLSAIEAQNHQWVKLIDQEEGAVKRRQSKTHLLSQSEGEHGSATRVRKSSKTHAGKGDGASALASVLAMHRALVHVQQERGMACWALASETGIGGISCLNQLQWHIQLSEKRILDVKTSLDQTLLKEGGNRAIASLYEHLIEARKLAVDAVRSEEKNPTTLRNCFDRVFSLYNQASGTLIARVAASIVAVRGDNDAAGRRAARRYRLYSSAAEQLGRERAFICAHGQGYLGLCVSSGVQTKLPAVSEEEREETPMANQLSVEASSQRSERLYKLAEIIGARKILLGTIVDGSADTVATSEGLLTTLIWEDEGCLFTPQDIRHLESLERRVLNPRFGEPTPTEDWYETITRFLRDVNSQIAFLIVEEVHPPEEQKSKLDPGTRTGSFAESARSQKSAMRASTCGSGCRATLKSLLQSLVDRL